MRILLTAAMAAALLPAFASAETLPEALETAYASNPTLQGAREVVGQAKEGLVQAHSTFLPRVTLSGSANTTMRITETETRFGTQRTSPADKTFEPQTASLDVRESLFEGGARVAQVGLARERITGAKENLRSTEQNVILAVIQAYLDVRRDEEVVKIRANNVDLLQQQLQAARDRFKVGEITRTDVSQSLARLSGAQAGLTSAHAQLEASRANYARVVGRAPGALEPEAPLVGLPANVDDAIDAAIDSNPDLQRFRANERAAAQQYRVERAQDRPQVALVGNMTRQIDPFSPGQTINQQSAGVQVTVPLYEGGLDESRSRAAKYAYRQAQAQTEEARRQVVSNTVGVWNSYLASLHVIDASKEQVKANEEALDGVQQEQIAGLRSTLEVLNAQQELLDSQLQLVRAQHDAYVASAGLLQAVGRLDAKSLGVNAALGETKQHRVALWTFPRSKTAPPP